MKKLLVVGIVLALFTMGCGHLATESEFYEHDSMYKNWDHMKFSLWGYDDPTAQTAEMSDEQGWWGIDIPYVPAQ